MGLRQAIGQRVRGLRQAKGMTLEEAAQRIGTDSKYLNRLELGQKNVTADTLEKILAGLGAEPLDLLGSGPMKPDQKDKEELAALRALLKRLGDDSRQHILAMARHLARLEKPRS